MKAINTILVATDLSDPARHAAVRAAMLAREQRAEQLDLLHVVSQVSFRALRRMLGEDADALEQRLMAEAEQVLQTLAQDLTRRFRVSVTARVTVGQVLDEIAATSDAVDAGLVIMGARGANFVREFMLGTTTEHVLRRMVRPVLAVRQFPLGPYRRVLVPVDFSLHSKPALELAHALAPDAQITLLHAFEVPFEGQFRLAGVSEDVMRSYRTKAKGQAQQDMEELIANAAVPQERLSPAVEHGVAITVILEKGQEMGADLIVIGKRGRSIMEELLLGSVTAHVLAYSDCDVLVAL
jgi:nucleotide-binding universal stress UspA family protein